MWDYDESTKRLHRVYGCTRTEISLRRVEIWHPRRPEDAETVSVVGWGEEWVGNYESVAEAVADLEESGYEPAFPEHDDDCGDPVNQMRGTKQPDPMWSLEVAGVYAREVVRDEDGDEIDYDAAVELMDDGLREELHAKMAPCGKQEFLEAYAEEHGKRFGEGFAPYVGEAW